MASSRGKLTPIQIRVLEAVAGTEPPFVLSGGAALAGVHLGHRTTRDLDLFWRKREVLGELPLVVEQNISRAGLAVQTLQTSPAFVRLRVTGESTTVVVDLIAEAADNLDPPRRERVGNAEILVDTARAILAEKLCAILERSELRDLIDIDALVRSGQDIDTAIADAPRRDSGFSPLTLAWVLRGLDIHALARAADLDDASAADLDRFRLRLIDELSDPRSRPPLR